jgi:hypothetical protein
VAVLPTKDMPQRDSTPGFTLYISTGTDTSPGKVYQCDENGRVLGKRSLPTTATGIAMHRDHGLVLALPRDGGKIMHIDDTGKLSTIIEKDPALPHPVDVYMPPDSDTVVVADNIAGVIAATSSGGVKPKVYQRLQGKLQPDSEMSIAADSTKHVIFAGEADGGVYRYGGDQSASGTKPTLPKYGCVATDPKSDRWAASQEPNEIIVYEGDKELKRLTLPRGKSLYRHGLLSFSPAGSLCVACRASDSPQGEVWLLMYDIDKGDIRSLFPWKFEEMTDFTVGPRMRWDQNPKNTYKSTF